MNKNILYKSMPADMICNGHKYKVGKWYKIKGKLKICEHGFHASKNILDAMGYVIPEILAKVEVRGKSIIHPNKECWEEMKAVKTYEWTREDSISLAIFAAELCIDNFEKEYPNDNRPRQAIEVAKKTLENDTEENKKDATYAARCAAYAADAAYATGSVAYDAARCAAYAARCAADAAYATGSAAYDAARCAAYAARCAADAAWSIAEKGTKNKIHKFIIRRSKL